MFAPKRPLNLMPNFVLHCNICGNLAHMIEMTDAVWMLDLDGVVWRGKTAITGSAAAIATLRARGARVLFVSNNSSLDVSAYLAKLASVGVAAPAEDLCTSAMAAAQLAAPGSRVMVLGGIGINEALISRSVTPVDAVLSEAQTVDAVIVGLDRQLSYDRLTAAVRAVLAGAALIVTNEDPTFPSEDGLNAGGGSIGAAVAYGSGATPLIAGKPHPAMASLIENRLGKIPAIMVGDQPITDGALASAMGIPFGLVLSGVATTAEGVTPFPALVAANLRDLVALAV
jgi:4-nitrophenyl phosphatase